MAISNIIITAVHNTVAVNAAINYIPNHLPMSIFNRLWLKFCSFSLDVYQHSMHGLEYNYVAMLTQSYALKDNIN